MRVLIATDAWHPQVNGVVRTLTSLAQAASGLGVSIDFLTPDGFPSIPLPTYPDIRLALTNGREIARRLEAINPELFISRSEGPIGFAVHACCRRRQRPSLELHPVFPRVRLGARAGPAVVELRRAAALSRGRDGDNGVDPVADGGIAQQGIQKSRDVDARRRHRVVQAAPGRRARSAAPDFRYRRPRRGQRTLKRSWRSTCPAPRSSSGMGRSSLNCGSASRTRPSSVRARGPSLRASSPPPMCSCFRAGPTLSGSFNWRRWPAAFRSRRSR